MSIFSKVKSAAKSYINNVVGGAKIAVGAVKNAVSQAPSSALASATSAVNMLKSGGAGNFSSAPSSTKPNMTMAPNTSTKYGPAYTSPSGRVTVYGQGGVVNQGASAVANSSSSRGGGSYTSGSSPIYSAPVTLMGGTSRSSLGSTTTSTSPTLSSMSLMSSPSTFGSISSQSFAPSPAISMPSKPSVSNPGTINNGGLIGALSTTNTYDPNTNSFLPKELANPENADPQQEGRIKIEQMLQDMIPKKENIYEDSEVQKQQREVQRRQQEVNNYTAQLNSVVAQQNADLLRLRDIGSKEGVTETVYGGQQATINREAAIKALPIQAQIAAAQGNLDLAQDYLTQLTTWKQEAIDLDYTYRKDVYNSIRDFADKEEALQIRKMEKEDDRAYAEAKDNIAEQDYWVRQAVANGQSSMISRINAINPTSPTFRQALGNIVSGMAKVSSGGGGGSSSSGGSTTPHPNAPKLTPTQLNTGSSLLGLAAEEYRALDPSVQTFFVGNGGKAFMGALNDINSGESTWEDVMEGIQSSIQPQPVKDYMHKVLNSVARPTEAPTEKVGKFANPFPDVWRGLKGIF